MYEAFIEFSIEATRYYEHSGGGQAAHIYVHVAFLNH